MKISAKIFCNLFFSSLSLLLLASTIFYSSEKNNLQRQIYNQLQSIASLQQAALVNIVEQNLERLQLVASRTQLRISFAKYLQGEKRDENQTKMIRILNDAKSSIQSFHHIHILSLKGKVIASTEKPDKVESRGFDGSILGRAQRQESADTLILDKNGDLFLLLTGPLFLNGNLLGIMVIETDVANFVASITNYTGLGKTGEIIVAKKNNNGDVVFLFPSRFASNAGLRMIVPKEKIDSPFIKGVSKQIDVIIKGIDYRGQAVLAVNKYLDQVDWTILVKIDEAEAFSAIAKAKNLIIIVTIGLILLSIMIGLAVSRSITKPVRSLTEATRKISRNGLLEKIAIPSSDEIGELATSFNEMINTRLKIEEEREKVVTELQQTLAEVKVLRGILPICSICKNIRNDEGYYEQIEGYLHKHSGVDFSHTICPTCMKVHYPEEYAVIMSKKK